LIGRYLQLLLQYPFHLENEKISIGKAAEAMGMRIIDFITDLGKMDIPYFDFSLEELMEDVKSARPSVVESE
jgi:predicted HTH domain antitoxin